MIKWIILCLKFNLELMNYKLNKKYYYVIKFKLINNKIIYKYNGQ